jgi:integration host factor subunit beta
LDEHDDDLDLGHEEAPAAAGVMTKAELVDEVARVVQLTKKQAETIVNIVFDSIVESLRAGQKIELRGFGSFRLRQRESRKGRNPKTGDKVDVPPKRVPYFKPGKELKDLINRDSDDEVLATSSSSSTASPASGSDSLSRRPAGVPAGEN